MLGESDIHMIHRCWKCNRRFECCEHCDNNKKNYDCVCDECDGGIWAKSGKCKIKFMYEIEKVIFT